MFRVLVKDYVDGMEKSFSNCLTFDFETISDAMDFAEYMLNVSTYTTEIYYIGE